MKSIYGLMTDIGNGNELMYDLGLWETEEAAGAYLKQELGHASGIWVEALVINDALSDNLDLDGDEMALCSQCGIEYNEADIIIIDDQDVCINCEPAFKENMPG
ncbi:MAG: hypothetical protein Q8906_02880 [Bacillota bacterium]|nr:hypothetical protein [Bacillota bacterium]MDP4169527.1 hypothetical protein [Bacillota bacterium]